MPVAPGKVQSPIDCPPEVVRGHVRVVDHALRLRTATRTITYDAYVDDEGALHVGFGTVAALDEDGRGRVVFAPSERLVVDPGPTCVYETATRRIPVTCRFETLEGRDLFVFHVPDATGATSGRTDGLVYLASQRLLVSPDLVNRAFTRP